MPKAGHRSALQVIAGLLTAGHAKKPADEAGRRKTEDEILKRARFNRISRENATGEKTTEKQSTERA